MKRAVVYIMVFMMVFACMVPVAGATGVEKAYVSELEEPVRDIVMTDEFYSTIEKNTNIEFIEISKDNSYIEYVYTEDGKNYKVVERMNPQLTYVESEIYIQNVDESYSLESFVVTDVQSNGDIIVSKKENGKLSTDTIKLEEITLIRPELKNDDFILNNDDFTLNDDDSILKETLSTKGIVTTGWVYHSSTKSSYRISTYTVATVNAIIIGICAVAPASVTIGVIAGGASLVSYIISDRIPQIYYLKDWYYMWKYLSENPSYKTVVGEKVITGHYRYSNYTGLVNHTTHINYP